MADEYAPEETETALPLPEPEPKKRVRATIADTVAIATALADLVEWSPEQDDIPAEERAHWYARGWSDERIARDRVPHLAAHHVTTVREALYPNWRKLPTEMTVEDRLDALEKSVHFDTEKRLAAIEAGDVRHDLARRFDVIERYCNELGQRMAALEGRMDGMFIKGTEE